MARLIHLGGETGHVHAEGVVITLGNVTISTVQARTGSRSFLADSDASALAVVSYNFSGAVDTRYFFKAWFYVPSASGYPAANTPILRFFTAGGAATLCAARLTTAGKIQLVNQSLTQIGSDSAATAPLDEWFSVELAVEIGTGSVDYAEARLDGVSVASTTTGAFSDSAPGQIRFGWANSGAGTDELIYVDDLILNDDNGSAHNTWPGDDKVVLLLPTADNSRVNWTGGAGGTSNLFEAINNVPPAGLDSAAATDTSQIENASAAGGSYVADLATYSSAGIVSGDTITALYVVFEGGNSSITGADQVTVDPSSNPNASNVTASVDSNDDTYPTGWLRSATPIAEDPSVTLGTAPQVTLSKVVSTTRVNACCFCAMYVSYIPAAAEQPVFVNDPRQSAVYRM